MDWLWHQCGTRPSGRWMRLGRSLRGLALVIVACCAALPGTGCKKKAPVVPDWSAMQFLLGDWGCFDFYQTNHGEVRVPLVSKVSRDLGGQWLRIHREEPGWSDAPANYIEDAFAGWDASSGRWILLSASTDGPQSYLTGSGWTGTSFLWDAHLYANISFPSRREVEWRKVSPTEWESQFHFPPAADGINLLRQHCYKREPPPLI